MKTCILTASALALVAASASAGPISISSRKPAEARIRYDDVNLHSAGGVAVVRHRIQLAAREVCREPRSDPAPELPVYRNSPCYKTAVASGMAQLHALAGN